MNMLPVLACTLPILIAGYLLYFYFRARKMQTAKILAKCTATLMCAAAAYAGLAANSHSVWTSLLFWGVIACALGDGLLEIHFISGMAAFGAGHVLLAIWIYALFPLYGGASLLIIVIWTAAYALALGAFHKYLRSIGTMKIAFLLYAALLMGMAAMAVVLPLRVGVKALSVAVGGALFAISDMFVAKGFFDKLSPVWDRFALAIYYIGVYCLAIGAWFL